MGHEVYNCAMTVPLVDRDVPEAYTKENPRLTYLHLGIMAALLLILVRQILLLPDAVQVRVLL